MISSPAGDTASMCANISLRLLFTSTIARIRISASVQARLPQALCTMPAAPCAHADLARRFDGIDLRLTRLEQMSTAQSDVLRQRSEGIEGRLRAAVDRTQGSQKPAEPHDSSLSVSVR